MIGYAFCGSFCTLSASLDALSCLVASGEDVLPIMSESVYGTDTRFFKKDDLIRRVSEITGKEVIHTVKDAEPLGPSNPLTELIIAPCTGNTLAKLASGITDGTVTMAAKAHLRKDRPLLLAVASNDAMGQNLSSLAVMLMRKSVYFLPMRQDDPSAKPHSLVADFKLLPTALGEMRRGRQMRPLFLT